MRQTGDQNAVPMTDYSPSGEDASHSSSIATALDFNSEPEAAQAKIHVVQTRAESALHAKSLQAARIRRLLLTSMFGMLYLVAMGLFYLQGMVSQTALRVAMILIGISFAIFYGCFALGLNLKAREKNLRMAITICAIGVMLVVVYLAPASNIIFTPFLFLMMAFVMHRVAPKTMLKLTLLTLGGYGLVVAMHYSQREDAAILKLECAQLLVLLLTLPGFAVLASRVERLHNALFKATKKIKDIEEDAQRDVLLGCFNRRYIVAALEQQKRLADEAGTALCVAVMDLDHFKRINDEAGHLGGDEVLRTFARITQDNVRQCDIFGRYGGEEFLLVLPDTALLAALNIAERVRDQVENFSWEGKLSNRVTVSIGLTQYIPGESVLDLFSRTDTAMYMAKQGGRNQVVVEEPAPA